VDQSDPRPAIGAAKSLIRNDKPSAASAYPGRVDTGLPIRICAASHGAPEWPISPHSLWYQ
jgi:hypothetical protein